MHHAAMANKKDMMFSLARLGCDWRARADGIDGATATYVLCGQHGKTTRQQKLLDAKLKRVAQEGSVARAAGRNPLVDARDDDRDDVVTADMEAEQALADAAMAALLEEEETEAESLTRQKSASSSASKKKKQKAKAKAKSKAVAAVAAAGEGEAAEQEEEEAEGGAPAPEPAAAVAEDSARHQPGRQSPAAGSEALAAGSEASQQQQQQQRKAKAAAALKQQPESGIGPDGAVPAGADAVAVVHAVHDALVGEQSAASSRADSAAESLSVASEHEVLRQQLEDAAEAAARLLAIEPTGEEGEAQLEGALQALDDVIERASLGGVSAKYGKKVRKKLQQSLNELRGIEPPESADRKSVV